jgi:hypothetical protein
LGAVTWRVPQRSLTIRKDIPPRFLTSWAQPITTTSFSASAGVRLLELRNIASLISLPARGWSGAL